MSRQNQDHLRVVRDYHQRTKHRPDRYAASLGYMDWANKPDPFRTFSGVETIDLPRPDVRQAPTYDRLFPGSPAADPLDADLVGRLFTHSLALSAWKQVPTSPPWSLRINPSSGALHPTEGYLISGPVPGLIDQDGAGVFHYLPLYHRLERRRHLSAEAWEGLVEGLPRPCLLVGLTSIYWRESWKYGERAFRYCHHDVGHAVGAIAVAARTLGWETRLLDPVPDEALNRLLGTHLQEGIEAEHADGLVVLFPAGSRPEEEPAIRWSPADWAARVPDAAFSGEPNRLSGDHHPWPVIEAVSAATRSEVVPTAPARALPSQRRPVPPSLIPDRPHPADRIIRRRRSAVAMDGETTLDRAVFYHILQRTLPVFFPFAALPWEVRVSLVLFVHRVEGLAPGLYLLARDGSHEESLRRSLRSDFEWRTPEGCPDGLDLFRLMATDVRRLARAISCHQAIASDGVFSLGMLAAFDAALDAEGAGGYPRLFWECGLIGQVLYLEAEAAGVRGTGIGCFFDDTVHDLLGIADTSWQSLYHFTVGGPVEDPRLKTIPPYAHLG